MKPSEIFDILDLTVRARKMGRVFNPLFVGAPGLGKSEIVQQWCKKHDMPFVDLRAALQEAPDMIGFPFVQVVKGRQRTVRALPMFWPTADEKPAGVLLLEEPNRGTTAVLNTFMQLLTDRKVEDYQLPEGWIIVGCINPENEQYDVTTMDPALKDRFEIFNIDYNRDIFVSYMRNTKWDKTIISFVESKTWGYVKPEDVAKTEGAKYISPRTLSKLNNASQAGIPNEHFEKIIYESILGRNVGLTFYHFKNNEQPVTLDELRNKKTVREALEKLRVLSDPKMYKADTVAITVRDILEDGTIDDNLLAQVLLAISADQGHQLIKELELKRKQKSGTLLDKIATDFPDVQKYMKNVLKQK